MTLQQLTESRPLAHPLTFSDLEKQRVTARSVWSDRVWVFMNRGGGRKDVVLNWDFEIWGNERALSEDWAPLTEQARHMLWALWAYKSDGVSLNPGTLVQEFGAITFLLRWMAETDHYSFSDISPESGSQYFSHIQKVYPPSKFSCETIRYFIDVLEKIFNHKDALKDVPGAVMAAHPYGGILARKLMRTRYRRSGGSYEPLDDQIFLEVTHVASNWLEAPARDVLRLVDIYSKWHGVGSVNGGRGHSVMIDDAEQPAESALLNFQFNDGGQLAEPWRFPLVPEVMFYDWTYETYIRPTEGRRLRTRWNAYAQLLRLIETLASACTIIIQASTGIRLSELCGLPSTPVKAGFPSCVETRLSEDGLTELFFLRGYLFKKSGPSLPAEWLAGSRPLGTDFVPISIQAVVILDQLFKPWREELNSQDLLIWLKPTNNLKSTKAGTISGVAVRTAQKEFIAREVKLDEKHGAYWNIGTHQWRKTFALFAVRVDEIVIPILADHFKHLSIATLEQRYIGNDPEMLGIRRDIASRELARILSRFLDGGVRFAGRMGKTLAEQAERIERSLPPRDQPEKRHKALLKLAAGSGVGIWPSDWGKCLFRAEKARCHEAATGSMNLAADSPHYGARRPGLCSGCANLMIGPEHKVYWQNRHRENLDIYKQNQIAGDLATVRISAERAKVSENILRKLGLEIETVMESAEDVEPF